MLKLKLGILASSNRWFIFTLYFLIFKNCREMDSFIIILLFSVALNGEICVIMTKKYNFYYPDFFRLKGTQSADAHAH